jgi:signal transduction histidine kinase
MRVLLIEDNEDDVHFIREMLAEQKSAGIELEWADQLGRGLTRLAEDKIDVVLLDLSLPDSHGLTTFDKVQAHRPDVPIVVLTGLDDEGMAVQAVRKGAQDYLVKTRLDSDRLVRALRYALERHRVEDQLRQSTAQLRALSGHLERVREEERTRIARELHDELGQMLTGLRLNVSWLSKRLGDAGQIENTSPLLEKTRSMTALIDRTIVAVRRLISELRPAVLDHLGLVAALEWQAGEFQQRTGIRCEFVCPLKKVTLSSAGTTAFFRILQEALTNVTRHAKAAKVTIRLEQEGDALRLAVEDNGRGIMEQEAAGLSSFGLIGLRERVSLLGGKMVLQGYPGKGTTLTAQIPLPRVEEIA